MEPETRSEDHEERRSGAVVVLIGAAVLIEALFLLTVLFVGASS